MKFEFGCSYTIVKGLNYDQLLIKNVITNLDNACEVYDGITHQNKSSMHQDICCTRDCGECGGKECWKRPGGEHKCCGANIRNTTNFCENPDRMAPCRLEKSGRFHFELRSHKIV